MIEIGWGRSTPAFRDLFGGLITPEAGHEQLAGWDELQRTTTSATNAARMGQEFHRIDVAALAHQVRVPTLVYHMRGDSVVPFEQGRRLAAMIPGAEFLPLEGNNHVLQARDRDWPTFVSALRGFLGDADRSDFAEHRFESLTQREHRARPTRKSRSMGGEVHGDSEFFSGAMWTLVYSLSSVGSLSELSSS